jgi:hypothetical protein
MIHESMPSLKWRLLRRFPKRGALKRAAYQVFSTILLIGICAPKRRSCWHRNSTTRWRRPPLSKLPKNTNAWRREPQSGKRTKLPSKCRPPPPSGARADELTARIRIVGAIVHSDFELYPYAPAGMMGLPLPTPFNHYLVGKRQPASRVPTKMKAAQMAAFIPLLHVSLGFYFLPCSSV